MSSTLITVYFNDFINKTSQQLSWYLIDNGGGDYYFKSPDDGEIVYPREFWEIYDEDAEFDIQ